MSEPCLEVHGCGRAGKTELGSVGSPSEILSEYEFILWVGNVAHGKSIYLPWTRPRTGGKLPCEMVFEDRADKTTQSYVDAYHVIQTESIKSAYFCKRR